jgi:transglutaminase-like putative cysteine protease
MSRPNANRLPQPPVFWALAAFAVAAIPHLLAFPPQVSLAVLSILGFRVIACWRGWRPLPVWLRFLVTVALIGLVAVSFGGLWGRRTATALLCVMMAAKTLEMYQIRDLRLLVAVCFFLIATQFLFNESLLYFAYLLLGCWTATTALLRIQRVRIRQEHFHDRPIDHRTLSLQAGRLLLISAPVALVLFFLFPRLAEPLWGMPDDALDGKTGLSETMSPGSISTLFADDSPAFRVEFDSKQPPPNEQRYWRGPVLWNFDGDTWRPSITSFQDRTGEVEVNDQAIAYEVQLEPHERRWLLALDLPARTDHSKAILSRDYQLVSREPITSLTAYRVISNPNYIDSPTLDPIRRRIATRLPDDRNPRTRAMAEEWRARYPDDRDLAEALLRWFRTEPFFYSLDTLPLGRHSADEFLFDLREGYCEYYASAFAVFMRAAGVPTRVVTGYQGGFWNRAGEYLLVRQSDAHAWNEIWLEEEGWVRFDPTAAVSPLRIREGSSVALDRTGFFDLALISGIRNQFDRLQHAWNQWVLGFDARAQVELLRRLGLPELRPDQIALLMLGVIAVVAGSFALVLLRSARSRSRDPAERAWRALQRRVHATTRLPRDLSRTPREWARSVDEVFHSDGPALASLAALYEQVRYGPSRSGDLQRFIREARAFSTRSLRREQ